MLPARPSNYIFPPRAKDAIPLSDATIFADLNWIAQLKYNDSRCLIKYQPWQPIELWNRHAQQFRTYQAPQALTTQLWETHDKLGLSRDSWSLLDGGLLNDKHPTIRNTIVLWDILVINGTHQLGTTYQDRYKLLLELTSEPWTYNGIDMGLTISKDILIPKNIPATQWNTTWQGTIETANAPYPKNSPLLEGLVFKNPAGKLERGMKEKNNSAWMCRSRVQTGRHMF